MRRDAREAGSLPGHRGCRGGGQAAHERGRGEVTERDHDRSVMDDGAGDTGAVAPQDEERPSDGTGDTAEIDDELGRARSEAQEYLGHLQRLQAEFDNYRKRVLREQTQ